MNKNIWVFGAAHFLSEGQTQGPMIQLELLHFTSVLVNLNDAAEEDKGYILALALRGTRHRKTVYWLDSCRKTVKKQCQLLSLRAY